MPYWVVSSEGTVIVTDDIEEAIEKFAELGFKDVDAEVYWHRNEVITGACMKVVCLLSMQDSPATLVMSTAAEYMTWLETCPEDAQYLQTFVRSYRLWNARSKEE